MAIFKSTWTTASGSISAIIPMFFTVCKSGVCTAACVSPLASLLGVSSAGLVASPLTQSLFPLLLVISAVAFTVSYYKIYIIPKYATSCNTQCNCNTTTTSFQHKFTVASFWRGLVCSVNFFTYFEYQNYKANSQSMVIRTSNNADVGASNQCDTAQSQCCAEGQPCSEN